MHVTASTEQTSVAGCPIYPDSVPQLSIFSSTHCVLHSLLEAHVLPSLSYLSSISKVQPYCHSILLVSFPVLSTKMTLLYWLSIVVAAAGTHAHPHIAESLNFRNAYATVSTHRDFRHYVSTDNHQTEIANCLPWNAPDAAVYKDAKKAMEDWLLEDSTKECAVSPGPNMCHRVACHKSSKITFCRTVLYHPPPSMTD